VLKIKVHIKVLERCFYGVNWTGFMGLLVYSLVECGGIKCNADDRNVDMIFIMLLDNIHMGITS
jgi:hypothetical protein